jgi:exodeoxyribonuclease-3
MKIATHNVSGVNGELPVVLRWPREAPLDIGLKAPQEKFRLADICKAGYGAIWHGQKAWNGAAILTRGTGPSRRGAGFPATPRTSTAAISRRLSVG